MATSYSIEVGYNSCHNRDDAWGVLKEVCESIQSNPTSIFDEVFRLEPDINRTEILGVCGLYEPPVQDLTIRIVESDERRAIVQMASGSGPSRDAKESCRRAFCRLVIEEMHRRKMEVSMSVY